MAKNLVIVESPSKSKTIEKYLGNDYKVVSSKGHIRDLATSGKYGLGVDIENNFTPSYIPISGKKKLISSLKQDVKNSKHVFLATDPDREGEAISWHLKDALGIKDNDYDRVLFHEITKNKVLEAMAHPSKIDNNLVRSQETRRILDRIIGFRLSKLLQSKIGAKSAGRVQSVALKLIVDREREIEAFVKEEYWTITAIFTDFEAELYQYDNKEITLSNEKETQAVIDKLSNEYKIISIDSKEQNKKARPPFITSTLQQECSTKLGFTAKKTMMLAQRLYEGVDIGDETVGLITYMRTDSYRLSDEFVNDVKEYITKEYGKDMIGYIKKGKKSDLVQDAHEAIRPTSILRNPTKIKDYLTNDEYKLYSFIYYRSLASLMRDAKVLKTTIILDNNNYQFKANGQILLSKGYLEVYDKYEKNEDTVLPDLTKQDNQVLKNKDIKTEQHFTKPPARYTEAKLIKEMEELGIGRPSTYAKTMDTLKERDYVTVEDKKFIPTKMGIETTDRLQEFFSDLINVKYTANMETDLDHIALGEAVWNEVLAKFYKLFEPRVKKAFDDMEKKQAETTGEICPECGGALVKRNGKFGEFIACSNYPNCKYIKKEEAIEKVMMDCPNCDGKIIEKKTKRGKIFYGCNNYPKCKLATWDKPVGVCPICHNLLIIKNDQVKCSSCSYQKNDSGEVIK